MKKKILIIVIIVLALILLVPIPLRLKDGGSIEYKALLYTITKYHKLDSNSETGYKDGIGIEILGMKLYSNIEDTNSENDNMSSTIKAVIVKVNENNLLAMGIENGVELYTIGLNNIKDIELKKEQEILIYFDGNIMETYPAQLGNIEKIEIIKEKSDIKIPDEIIRFCYNSKDNVDITILELSRNGITLIIKDTNDLPYNYSHSYIINKKVKNENYTGVGEQIGENTNNSTAAYTGTGLEYIWKEVDRISNISSESTQETLIYNLPNISEGEEYFINEARKFDWSKLYGTLDEGEYEFILSDDNSLTIRILFTINSDGKLTYDEPSF